MAETSNQDDAVLTADAPAKLNLALVVGPLRSDGKHEVVTVLQRLELADRVEVRRATEVAVDGYEDDTIVRAALELLLAAEGSPLAARIEKKLPVAAGLGGGSSDAATALRLGNLLLDEPLSHERLHQLAAGLGADVPFFLDSGPQLGTGDGSSLAPLTLPQDYTVLLALPASEVKESTEAVYRRFEERNGPAGFEQRRADLMNVVSTLEGPRDFAALPANDLAASALADEVRSLGAFRADVTGAGPTVYGLFDDDDDARAAAAGLEGAARTWVTRPRW
jgi:4-diphosphocytidyl-2-C-methyl-D-erythritol kinase